MPSTLRTWVAARGSARASALSCRAPTPGPDPGPNRTRVPAAAEPPEPPSPARYCCSANQRAGISPGPGREEATPPALLIETGQLARSPAWLSRTFQVLQTPGLDSQAWFGSDRTEPSRSKPVLAPREATPTTSCFTPRVYSSATTRALPACGGGGRSLDSSSVAWGRVLEGPRDESFITIAALALARALSTEAPPPTPANQKTTRQQTTNSFS